jgi:REP element-mobilizing transposase RayT
MGVPDGTSRVYLITWVCYGTWLPGRPGSVERHHGLNRFNAPFPEPNPEREEKKRMQLVQTPFELDILRRRVVLASLREVCCFRGWTLLAAHVRPKHVHVVVSASVRPERVMIAFKAYSTRLLNSCKFDEPDRRRWATHGSTRYLWTAEAIRNAIVYVVHEQGPPMAVYEAPPVAYAPGSVGL